ncbi:MAG: alpha/beta fold hydrolase [Pseudomonadales bacterium]
MQLTPERLFSDPPLFGGLPQNPQFTPDGRAIAFLRSATDARERLDLWRYDLTQATAELWLSGDRLDRQEQPDTAAEAAERERKRQFNRGITAVQFSTDGRLALLPVEGVGWVLDIASGSLRAITPAGTRQTDLTLDPQNRYLSYVRDGDLYVTDLEHGEEQRITHDGGEPWLNGSAEFIAQEEMHRFRGHWWSPSGRYLAYTRVDESLIPVSQRPEFDADQLRIVPQRYPFTGGVNARVELRVRDMMSGEVTEVPWTFADDDYLARAQWWQERLLIQVQSRDQRTLRLVTHAPDTNTRELLLEEHADHWVNLHDNCQALDDSALLWTSERDGHAHLYVWSPTGLRQVTRGTGRVNKILWADSHSAIVQGWFETATEQHAYRVHLAGGADPERLTQEPGWHDTAVSSDGTRLLDRVTSLTLPAALRLLSLEGNTARGLTLAEERVTPEHAYAPYLPAHCPAQLGTLLAEDGQLLHYRLTEPGGPRPANGYPVIVHVYGGPGVQRVRNEWQPLTLQMLAQHGYGVLELDNRGTGNRSPAFEAPIHRLLGDIEVRDQLVGVQFLRSLGWVDATRIGVMGHSYGGYMALQCLFKAPEHFRAAVSTAPVTDWHLYDTHYTERYLGTPGENAEGYRLSSVFPWLCGSIGKLLVIHGMADDNVLYTHSTQLYRALQARKLPFEMMAYPGSKHALQEQDVSIHRFNLILDFFDKHLKIRE